MATLQGFRRGGLTFDLDDSGGSGDPVVLLHGFPQTRSSWHLVTPGLVQAGYRVLAPDQRGYSPGARPPRRRDYALQELVADVLALADEAQLGRFHVVGHDWGGAVAWALGAAHPDRIATLTSLSTPHPKAMQEAMLRSGQLLRSWYMLAFQLPGVAERVLAAGGGRQARQSLAASGLRGDQLEASVRLLVDHAKGPLSWYRGIPFGSPRLGGSVSVPTLYVYGTGDVALGRTAADRTASHVTGPYTYEVLEGIGHWIPEEAADQVTELLVAHLAGHPV